MGAHYRRKYTVLRHWLIHQSKTGFVQIKVAEKKPNIDFGSPNLVLFRRENSIGAYSRTQFGREYLYPERDLPVTAT
jgi:hypothetical protein